MSTEDLDRALDGVERVLLDSSGLIAFHISTEATHAIMRHLLGRISDDSDTLRGYYSVASAVEVLIRPIRSSHDEFKFMHEFLTEFPNLFVLPMDLTVATQAAALRASMGLSFTDAVIVASGLLSGCQAIVSNDRRWQQRGAAMFSQFRWIYLDD